jgi:hypothetical protein
VDDHTTLIGTFLLARPFLNCYKFGTATLLDGPAKSGWMVDDALIGASSLCNLAPERSWAFFFFIFYSGFPEHGAFFVRPGDSFNNELEFGWLFDRQIGRLQADLVAPPMLLGLVYRTTSKPRPPYQRRGPGIDQSKRTVDSAKSAAVRGR